MSPSPRPEHARHIAPFVAWMATQSLDEDERRRHRQEIEAFLRWRDDHPGPTSGARRRYEDHVVHHAPERLRSARAGLDRYAEYQLVRARTLPAR